MNPEDLEIMLDEIGVQDEDADSILSQIKDTDISTPVMQNVSEEYLIMRREDETDWRKKAIISAMILKMHLND